MVKIKRTKRYSPKILIINRKRSFVVIFVGVWLSSPESSRNYQVMMNCLSDFFVSCVGVMLPNGPAIKGGCVAHRLSW